MEQASIIGIDISKRFFQLHGTDEFGATLFKEKAHRSRFLEVLDKVPRCTVVMETCGGAHRWGRAAAELGFDAKPVPAIHAEPFVRRQKHDAADAAAIAEAARRPDMRFAAAESVADQGRAMMFRTRELLLGQRTQTINALRGHLAEFGIVAPQGRANVGTLLEGLEGSRRFLPPEVPELAGMLADQIDALDGKIGAIEAEIRKAAKDNPNQRRLMTMPGVGPMTAMAVAAFAPELPGFRRGRDFAAWLGPAPRELSTGGKQRLGRITKMGQRDIRRLLVLGATGVIRQARRKGAVVDPWLARMLERKPVKVVAVALANKMARGLWAMSVKGEDYRARGAVRG